MPRYIEESEVKRMIIRRGWMSEEELENSSVVTDLPSAQPETLGCVNCDRFDVVRQIMWERDLAIEQLKELGYSLGEKIRTDGDTISRQDAIKALGEEPEVWVDSDYEIASRTQWNTDRLAIETVPPAQQWIPVTERLPERCSHVLVTDWGEIELAYYSSEGKWYAGDYKLKNVTAWMPLPEPWKGESDAKIH